MSDNYDGPQMAQKIMRQQEQIERLTAELAETQLLTTRDDYAALERICNEMARDMDALRAALKASEWAGPAVGGERRCPLCGMRESAGHDADCEIDAALAPQRTEP